MLLVYGSDNKLDRGEQYIPSYNSIHINDICILVQLYCNGYLAQQVSMSVEGLMVLYLVTLYCWRFGELCLTSDSILSLSFTSRLQSTLIGSAIIKKNDLISRPRKRLFLIYGYIYSLIILEDNI